MHKRASATMPYDVANPAQTPPFIPPIQLRLPEIRMFSLLHAVFRTAIVNSCSRRIIDATNGGIFIFVAPGSTVRGNTIISENRITTGGINDADYYPFPRSFKDVVVSGNTYSLETFGSTFLDNTFTSSTSTGYFGYGISVEGHTLGTFTRNNFVEADFGGVFSASCQKSMPMQQSTVHVPLLLEGNVLQSGFEPSSTHALAIDVGTGDITTSDTTYTGSTPPF
ncbi:hypothetical protein JCM11641_003970 [Rhodosporidiobolus odoratus]